MSIRPAVTEEDWRQVNGLLKEYFAYLSHDHSIDISYQGIEDELKSLPAAFSPPAGCMLLAEVEGQAAGCVALRPLGEHTCEMKRMYVRPEYRGKGLGKALGMQIIQEAKSRGYHVMRLDTADTMHSAQGLYASLGFKPIPPYSTLPADALARAIFMELALI